MRPGDRPVPARVGATDAGRQCRTNSAVVQLGLPPGRSAGARSVCTRGSSDPILRPVLAQRSFCTSLHLFYLHVRWAQEMRPSAPPFVPVTSVPLPLWFLCKNTSQLTTKSCACTRVLFLSMTCNHNVEWVIFVDSWYNCHSPYKSVVHTSSGTSTRLRAFFERAKLKGLALANAMSALLTAQFGAHRHQIDVAGALVSVQVVPCLSSVNAMCRRRLRCGALLGVRSASR